MSKIEWTGETVNPLLVSRKTADHPGGKVGWLCLRKSIGCKLCYAERLNLDPRAGGASTRRGNGLAYSAPSFREGEPIFRRDVLEKLLRKRKPTRIFPCDMTDLFLSVVRCDKCGYVAEHEHLATDRCQCGGRGFTKFWPSGWIQEILDAFDELGRRGFVIQVLTKRVARMAQELRIWSLRHGRQLSRNVWLGFSAENQDAFDERWRQAREIALRTQGIVWVSYGPARGPIDFSAALQGASGARLSWGVVGGESGRGAAAFDPDWARSFVYQFEAAGVPPFVKQLGRNVVGMKLAHPKGGDQDEWPDGLRVRKYPPLPEGVLS